MVMGTFNFTLMYAIVSILVPTMRQGYEKCSWQQEIFAATVYPHKQVMLLTSFKICLWH